MLANEHRDEQGEITLARMQVLDCHSKIRVFEPLEEYRRACPHVLVVCSGEHSHPIPVPNKTPSSIRSEIFRLLQLLDYDLPDLTPRRFLRHPTTLAYLRQQLPDIANPMLMDLHPSLANRDHIRAYIKQVQETLYPGGTGWDGEGLLAEKEKQDSDILQYIRLAEEFNLPESDTDGDDDPSAIDSCSPFRMVICMFPEASRRLAKAQYLQCDIGFKRIVGFQEFELGGMDEESHTTIVYCRIYLNRQTASAHQLLFQKIDDIVKIDTGSSLCILQVTADQHGGQAKGLGLYLKALARELPASRYDVHEPQRPLSSLDEYDHLRRIFRLCAVHVQRNIQQAGVTDDVKEKMRSLICTYHYTWEDTLEYIRVKGGKAGSDVNREGVACTLVGGMKKGLHYDTLKLRTLNVFTESGVRTSYDRGSVSDAASRTLKRMANKRHNNLVSQDKAIEKRNKRLRTAHLTKARAEIRLSQVATSSTITDCLCCQRAIMYQYDRCEVQRIQEIQAQVFSIALRRAHQDIIVLSNSLRTAGADLIARADHIERTFLEGLRGTMAAYAYAADVDLVEEVVDLETGHPH
ncbi:hypothetical protein EYR36_010712 [Pleurotus pulmonarius]|nr:hypothetical protein EYR36_010712 [Pleurotus pulmonarius]